jgi:hypothetical protein
MQCARAAHRIFADALGWGEVAADEIDNALIFNSCRGTVYTVVDATTGQKLADYETKDERTGPIACYAPDPDRFFTLSIRGDEHRLEIVEAAPK